MFISSCEKTQGPPARLVLGAREFLVFDALRQHGVFAKAALLVFLVILEIALEPFDVAVAYQFLLKKRAGLHLRTVSSKVRLSI